ncbi:MAG TPA: ABC transporter substrate-binding protein [Gaiellaceae bacterium]|nr:ABC transporter substrate-binding protein [Gaiellaceae bacterium]
MPGRLWLAACTFAVGASLLVAATPAGSDSATTAFRQGGTLRVNLPGSDIDDIDPSLAYGTATWHIEYSTALKLLNYPDAPGPRGSRLVPEGASSFRVSQDGTKYTSTIRKGFQFSNGEPVTAQNYAFALNRAFDRDLQSPGFQFMADPTAVTIIGSQDVREGRTSTASGVRARGNRLIVRLEKPDGTFLSKLSMPFFQALPLSLPRDRKVNTVDTEHLLPSAGPYYVSWREPNRRVTLSRNPFYAKNVSREYRRRPSRLSTIDIKTQANAATSYQELRASHADYAYSLPPDVAEQLEEEFGLHGRFRVRPSNCISYIALNSNNRLFHDNPQLRRAVNYVIDREAMVELSGEYAALPTDQYLPIGFPGFKNIDAYPFTPNLRKAQELARGHVPSGGPWVYYYSLYGPGPARMELVPAQLRLIGIEIDPQGSRGYWGDPAGRRSSPHAFATSGWCQDYPDPYDFINILLYGRSIREENNNNVAYFNNPAYDNRMERAARLIGAARIRAYEKLEHDLVTKEAPWAAWGQPARAFLLQRQRRHKQLRLPADLRVAAVQPPRAEVGRPPSARVAAGWTSTSTRAKSSSAASAFPPRRAASRQAPTRRARPRRSWTAGSPSRRRC